MVWKTFLLSNIHGYSKNILTILFASIFITALIRWRLETILSDKIGRENFLLLFRDSLILSCKLVCFILTWYGKSKRLICNAALDPTLYLHPIIAMCCSFGSHPVLHCTSLNSNVLQIRILTCTVYILSYSNCNVLQLRISSWLYFHTRIAMCCGFGSHPDCTFILE